MKNSNKPISSVGPTWEEVRKQLLTPEEIAASDLRVEKICQKIEARHTRAAERKKLEEAGSSL